MPLARILTHHPERATALSSQLQEQGYKVETASPDQTNLGPADLEIEFEICERADVLERAADLAEELQADVAVAPGVMDTAVMQAMTEPAKMQPAESQPAEIKPAAEIQPALSRQPAAVQGGVEAKRDPEREFEEAFAQQAQLPQEDLLLSEIEVPVMERAPMPPVAFLDDNIIEVPVHAEIAQPPDPVPYLAQLTPFGTPQIDDEMQKASLRAELAAERSQLRKMPKETAPPAQPQHTIWRRGAAFTARTVANARAITASTVESFREQALEYRKKAQIRSAEQRAAHEARLLDLEQRRAEAQQRATELEAAREAAAARLVELVRQRDPGLKEEVARENNLGDEVLRTASPRVEEQLIPPAPAAPKPPATRSWRLSPVGAMALRPRRPMSPQLRTVLTGAAAVTALFVVGIVLGSLYPRTPLAKPAAQSVPGTATPGGGVTVQTGGVTVKTGNQPTQAAPVKPSTDAAIAQDQTLGLNKPSPKVDTARRIAAAQGEETLGDDVVIRRFQRPVPTQKPKQNGQQAVLKHFSDLEN